ncbi:hypothetical protein [Paludisphaera borealis]|uniref:DUF4864 domain-containing protein n=1 Tax=Paludisphaera borealis TaxID=1387353 RepID=A0A1U7CYP7_9BACT|nr:hypothetical protein [Paludisphaera borealis]APW64064.1 hypothetical protein BSF38_05654 [Paludisphaera borealis]
MTQQTRNVLIGAACFAVLALGLAYEVVSTRPVRQAVQAYSELVTLANRPDLSIAGRLEAARPFFSARYLATHDLQTAREGGLVGLPRYINKNFQAWRQGPAVWLCPSNRIGPVYQLVKEDGRWKFDGLIGILRSRNVLVPASEMPE